jgi:NADH:ubiquinone oxidoreductase subunit 6 (subunit J)
MGSGIAFGLLAAVASGFAAILAGRNLTRSITAAAISIAGLGIALTASGAGFVGFFLLSVAAMSLTTIQLFGWMLVDVDRDHLPPTDRVTWIARSLAFLLLGGGLFLLVWIGGAQGSLTPVAEILEIATPGQIGEDSMRCRAGGGSPGDLDAVARRRGVSLGDGRSR